MPGKRSRKGSPVVTILLAIMALSIMVMAGVLSYMLVSKYFEKDRIREGFSSSDLVAPARVEVRPVREDPPVFIRGGIPPPSMYSVSFPVNATTKALEAFEGVGGVLNLTISNGGVSDLYIEKVTIETGWGDDDEVLVGRYVLAGLSEQVLHRVISIPSPIPTSRDLDFDLTFDILIGPLIGETIWTRREGVRFDSNPIQVTGVYPPVDDHRIIYNLAEIFDSVVPGIEKDMPFLSGLAENISDDDEYTVSDIVDVALFLEDKLEYISDTTDSDEWLSPRETFERGGGDCEDWSALYAGLITAMGGSARVVLSDRHVICSVYIGQDDSALAEIVLWFGTELPLLVHKDDLGFWLVMDPQGGSVFGWMPLNTVPSYGGDPDMSIYGYDGVNWRFTDSASVYMVDIYI